MADDVDHALRMTGQEPLYGFQVVTAVGAMLLVKAFYFYYVYSHFSYFCCPRPPSTSHSGLPLVEVENFTLLRTGSWTYLIWSAVPST